MQTYHFDETVDQEGIVTLFCNYLDLFLRDL